ncbi:tyrosine-type recombinase/integrase [Candidatus Sulfurimonas baltica]|uniref:Site-specific integrase n=1 Tax=Candidatus Sulfurimonas baltica TaxID=2740404 RepID=A0A7S7RMT4_9BACT|nr:site-specific integrase [Candidatus Sulfurimonas baltica]QOY52617.1 site-specific integrase [Candidatus Sulfurimonas baltica]
MMGFRKLKGKKYNSIYEYFKDSDKDKRTIAYYIQYRDIDNNPKKIKCDARNKDEALKILNDKKAEIAKDRIAIQKDASLLHQKVMNNNLTLEDVAKLYFPTKTAKTVDMISSGFYSHINPTLGSLKISKIKTDDIKKLSEELKKKPAKRGAQSKAKSDASPLNPRTVKKQISNLRALFNWAIKEGYVDKNPVVIKDIIKVDNNEPGRVMSDDELEKLWNLDEFILKPRLLLFLKACYHTGARPSAVMDIRVKHINFDKGIVHIKAMKQGKPYEARVSKELLDVLKSWISEHELVHDNFIFYPLQLYKKATTDKERIAIKNRSTRYQGYAELLRKIFDIHFNQNIGPYDLAYRVTVYTMRRTAATNVYKRLGIVHAKRFLNHTEIDTTMKYLNIDDDMELVDYGL